MSRATGTGLVSALYQQTAYVAAQSTSSARADLTHAAEEAITCQFVQAYKRIVGPQGKELVSTAQFQTTTEIFTTDMVWAPGVSPRTVANGRRPLRVDAPVHPLTGQVDHWEVYL